VSLEIDQKQVEGASQLSAMFDGELPAAECELLSRRLARDEQLRARWARYALIGAAMRSEPVAAVSGDFSRRVGAAIDGGAATGVSGRPGRNLSWMRNLALGAGVAAGVAGAAIFVLRSEVLLQDQALSAYTPTAVRMAGPAAAAPAMPLNVSSSDQALPASLANYMVAHSEYSSPLLRRGLISALVASDTAEPVKPRASGSAAAGPAPDNGGY
jgi:negative regulator of sigma E activity